MSSVDGDLSLTADDPGEYDTRSEVATSDSSDSDTDQETGDKNSKFFGHWPLFNNNKNLIEGD
jgi:hypothetical protein